LGIVLKWLVKFPFFYQGLASVFNISLGIVSWWTSKESDRYNRLIQLRVFAFCVNILHAYITGPIIYQNDDSPLLAPGTFTGIGVVLGHAESGTIPLVTSIKSLIMPEAINNYSERPTNKLIR
jgi:hypothetical protein